MLFNRCPSEEALQEFAAAPSSERIARHVGDCAACRGRVERFAQDHRLFETLREMRSDQLTPEERARIVSLCMQIADEDERRR